MPKTDLKPPIQPKKVAVPIAAQSQREARDAAQSFITRRRMIKITRPSKLLARPAAISFQGLTAPISPEFAEAMAASLMEAAKDARALNIPHRSYFDIDNPDGYYGR